VTTDDEIREHARLSCDERKALIAPLEEGAEAMRAECIADRVALMVAAAHAEADQRPDEGDYRYVPVKPSPAFNDPHVRAALLREDR
jgi:hypothetical protein